MKINSVNWIDFVKIIWKSIQNWFDSYNQFKIGQKLVQFKINFLKFDIKLISKSVWLIGYKIELVKTIQN